MTTSTIATAANVTVVPAKRTIAVSSGGQRIRVAAYCRVSTEQENQQNSYATQIAYYTNLINNNPNWQLVGIFADEGLSGTQTTNRKEFNKMIKLARRKKVDLILCKSISRFARNTVDCLDHVRELKTLGVTVKFEKENIDTSSMSSEFAITLYASFAQAESESISKNVTWGIEKAFREGKVRYQLRQMLGYRMGDDGVPVIVEDEAETVRTIFRMYADGYSTSDIARYLCENGCKRWNGETNWTRNHVYQILQNEKYVGDAILQKSYTVDCITHERADNNGQKPKYYVQDCHPAIVDRRTLDRVKLELEKRRKDAKRGVKEKGTYHTKYCLSRLLVCPYCSGLYKRTTWAIKGEKMGVWRCVNRLNKKSCPKSPSYHEDVLQRSIIAAVNSMIGGQEIENAVQISVERMTAENNNIDAEIAILTKKLTEIEKNRDAILGCVSGSMFEQMSDELNALNQQEKDVADRIDVLQKQKENNRRNILKSESAVTLFTYMEKLTKFDETIIDRLVEKIETIDKDTIAVTFCGGFRVVQGISQ